MKQILMPIKPKWLIKILNGEKTLEIRKTAPKEWTDYLNGKTDKKPEPMLVHIYCTKGDYIGYLPKRCVGKVVASFVLEDVEMEEIGFFSGQNREDFDGNCTPIYNDNLDIWAKESLVSREELLDYANKWMTYAWHISGLRIFNPKELSNFLVKNTCRCCPYRHSPNKDMCDICEGLKPMTRAPRSWCYVEEEKCISKD